MKSLTKMLKKSNMTPKERILTIIKNSAHYRMTGKRILSELDVELISDNWNAKSRHDADEYNKYWYMWDTFKYFEIDMQNLVNSIQIDYSNFERILLLYYYREKPGVFDKIIKSQFPREYKNGFPFILENTGLDYKNTVHTYTFLSLHKKIQEDILLLDESAKWESKYLDEEEILLNFLKDKKSLSGKEIEKLSDEIIKSLSWDRVRDKSKAEDISYFILSVYFAGYPIIKFAKKLADDLDIPYENDEDLKEKVSKIKGLRKKLRDVIYEKIEGGLFFEEYVPLCNENSHETYSGKTVLKLKEVFNIWIEEKNKTKKMFQKMIKEKELTIKKKTQKIIDFTITKKIITGSSLYHSNKNFLFISEYKKQVESLAVYGFLYNLLEKEDLPKKYGYILSHQKIIKKVSKIVGMKVTNTNEKYLKQIEELAKNTNLYLRAVDNNISEFIYEENKWNFPVETYFEKFRVSLKNVRPIQETPHKLFNKKAKELLGTEWTDLK